MGEVWMREHVAQVKGVPGVGFVAVVLETRPKHPNVLDGIIMRAAHPRVHDVRSYTVPPRCLPFMKC